VEIQEKSQARNDYGEAIETWSTVKTVWASVEPLRGQEYRESRLQAQATSHRIRIRYYAGLSPENRVRFKGRIFEFESVIAPLEKRDLMELMCREMV
jgi:SPP1 family predicted phage head-tail adaptor